MNKQIALTIEISKLYSLNHPSEKALTIGEGLYLATKGPGQFYGNIGSFEKGYDFDALVIHMTTTSKGWNGRLLKSCSNSFTTAMTAISWPAM